MTELILRDIGILAVVTVFFAIILVIAQKVLNNYGILKIRINKKRDLDVQGGNTLLSSLADKQIFIPSACGGRGSCGACKCVVTEGGGPLLPTEKPLLSKEEIAGNVRLACQVKVKSEVQIEIPENIFNIRRFRTKVTKIEDYTYDTKGITFTLLDPDKISFKAGQYMQLESQPYAKMKQKVVRAYSISSKPQDETSFQLIIRLVPEGICTTWVHNYLKEGDEVYLTGPYGDFFIRDTEADIIFVAGGSGKAPIKAMLEDLEIVGCNRKMTYYFGARTTKDLYLTEYMQHFEAVFPDFQYMPVLSHAEPAENWKGRTGFVMPYFKERIENPKNTEAYLCGSPGMINAVTKGLIEMGVPQDKIYYDSFG